MVPAVAVQVTAVSDVPVTVAMNCCVAPALRDAVAGLMVTLIVLPPPPPPPLLEPPPPQPMAARASPKDTASASDRRRSPLLHSPSVRRRLISILGRRLHVVITG